MSKNRIPMERLEDDFVLDLSRDSSMVADKLPADITGGATLLDGFLKLRCSDLVPFQGKGQEDFSPLDETTFTQLMESISKVGVLEPIMVRRRGEKFEILAGEHRWKASKALDLPTIPAHVVVDCDDQQAMMIFTMTNLARRTSTLRDLVNGWWLVGKLTRYQRSDRLQTLIDKGLLSDVTQSISKKQQKRYAALHDLHPDLFVLVESKQISIESGGKLAALSPEKQEEITAYAHHLKSKDQVEAICALCETDGGLIHSENLESLLDPGVGLKKKPWLIGTKQAKNILKRRIPEEEYDKMEEILQEALDLYAERYPGFLYD